MFGLIEYIRDPDILRVAVNFLAVITAMIVLLYARDPNARRVGYWAVAITGCSFVLNTAVLYSESAGKKEADARQRDRSEKLLSSVERGVYNTADPSLELGYEVDLVEAGLDDYKNELEGLLNWVKAPVDKQGKSQIPKDCAVEKNPCGLPIITCPGGQPGVFPGLAGDWYANLPTYGFQIAGGSNIVLFRPTSGLGLKHRDALVANLLNMSGIAVRFLESPATPDKTAAKAEFAVLLGELQEPQHSTVLQYRDGKLIVSSGSTRLTWTPRLDWRWTAGTAIGSVINLLGTEAEARPILSSNVCVGLSDVDLCRNTARKFMPALRVTRLTIAFPHRRDIVFQTAADGNRRLVIKFPETLADFPEAHRTPQFVKEFSEDEGLLRGCTR
jgi:hypothetical protein